MGTRSKDRIKAMIAKDISNIHNYCLDVKQSINDNLEDTLDYLRGLIAQIPQSASGPLITKTPKVLKKKGVQRIETIPENDIINIDNTVSDSIAIHDKTESKDTKIGDVVETTIGRAKRQASRKAATNIKKQQSISLSTKLRRPLPLDDDSNINRKRESRSKRKKSARSSSDEETTQGPTKYSKTEQSVLSETISQKNTGTSQDHLSIKEDALQPEKIEPLKSSMTTRSSNRKRTFTQSENTKGKNSNIIDDTVIAPTGNDIEEPSMYEDALEKPTPIMNSTMNVNSTYTQKMMNATVILEPLSAKKLNETVVINKNVANSIGKNNEQKTVEPKAEFVSPKLPKFTSRSSIALEEKMQQLKEAMTNKEFDELLTEDESSPEVKKSKGNVKKQEIKKRQKRQNRSMTSSEDEILNTPTKPSLKEKSTITGLKEIRNTYKSNALFSPYAKESVKKRVEAFEQAGMNTPKLAVHIDAPTRVTRTKTRAIRAAAQTEASENANITEKAVVQKLARKSLAKAKKISLAKQNKDADEYKENKLQLEQKVNKLASVEKMSYKQQQKTTPLSKIRTQLPMSVNRVLHTPANQTNMNHNRALSATRTNIITSVESLIQAPKSVSKRNSLDKVVEEKKRKLNDEDAKRKREEALRLQTEERKRKRQEKELKNKLAREAKEKQDMEKRQKAEKEREEKARLAQQMQERQREEIEKKRLAQLQRAQEKEERRKQEEQQRLQRLQEQEEAERLLAEQRRREQEAERRKEAELRAQQQAAAEAMRTKHQMLIKYGSKQHGGPTTYILDSEPDDDESDDESKPKHAIPHWAQSYIRKNQLAMQRYIPERAVYKFFGSRKCTPDLTQMFQNIDRSRLQRTSSAIWKTPPRYSMMENE
ncbi:trichohyalin [Bombus impatiens]|uniref:Trichohyalin n=1 Tax=Bombus impatiens TaxID=132113 RepID=A0A6P3DU59_BOMIM|nr:trichohyalin [Bombus impatiens]